MNEGAPAVSVLLSCYNGDRWLAESIESVLRQTLQNFEFIVVDDGSTDKSASIIRYYAKRDNRIVVISKANSGLADSLNVGIEAARGRWIARMDADDISEPDRLALQLAKAREDPGLVFVGTGLVIIDEGGKQSKAHRYPTRHSTLVRNLSTSRKFPAHSSAFYRTDAVRLVGGYRTRIRRAQDHDLWLRLSEVGRLTALEQPLVRIRKHPWQISHDDSGRTQRTDSRVAIVSYWIRRQGQLDPVSADAESFGEFREWLTRKIEQERSVALPDYVALAKTKLAELHESPFGFLSLAQHLMSEPALLALWLRAHLIGQTSSRRLANEWVRFRRVETAYS